MKYPLDAKYTVALINPSTTDLTRKMQLNSTKDDNLEILTICDVLATGAHREEYCISNVNTFDLYEQKRLTHEHHDLREQKNIYTNKLQKCIDIVFPEFNDLFKSKYGTVYMNTLKTFGSEDTIAHADIRRSINVFK